MRARNTGKGRRIVPPVSNTRNNASDRRRPGAVSIRDVASVRGVSIATVSRAVNRIPTVNADLARRVWKAIEEVGYLPNTQARAHWSQAAAECWA
jgi:hypothetical protein